MSARFEILKPMLDRYKRGFSVLDLGAGINEPTIGFEIAEAYPESLVVEVEQHWTQKQPMLSNQIVLAKTFSAATLQLLNQCEHFDIVLAFNFLHWFDRDDNWELAAVEVLGMGDTVYVQLPNADEISAPNIDLVPELHRFIMSYGGHYVGETVQFPGHPARRIWQIGNSYKNLTRTHMGAELGSADMQIISGMLWLMGMDRKRSRRLDWTPGINLWNFCLLGGAWPGKKELAEKIREFPLPEKQHGDITPWNFVMTAKGLKLVDGFEDWGGDDGENLERTALMVEASL